MSNAGTALLDGLAYVGVESPDAEKWRLVGPGVFGLELAADEGDGVIRLRSDERHVRLAMIPGERNRLAYVGWDVADDARLEALAARLAEHGYPTTEGDADLLQRRHVKRLIAFDDPFGNRHELVVGAALGAPWKPGRAMRGRFVTGDAGAGHVVMIAPRPRALHGFLYERARLRALGYDSGLYRNSILSHEPSPSQSRSRAHSRLKGLHHVMFEVTELDDVGIAYDALSQFGIPITMTLGRHPNDRMLSFYCRVPGGFEVEYGWGGLRIEEPADWNAGAFEHISEWGHKPQDVGAPGAVEPFVEREPARA